MAVRLECLGTDQEEVGKAELGRQEPEPSCCVGYEKPLRFSW